MRAAFGNHALIQHDDAIGIDHRREPMRDDQRRTATAHAFERILDFLFGIAVQRRRGLVEHEDRRALENGAGNGHALLFATGQLQARSPTCAR